MSYKLVFDFTCRIEGQEDRIHMVQQRHDKGYGLVIRSEKDDIWERLSGSEAFRLEEKLLDEVEYRTYHNRIQKLDSLSACREMYFELMKERPHTCRLESVIYEHATHFVFPESMLKTMLPIGSGIFMKLAFQAARKYPKECQSARMDIDQRVRNAVAEWKSTERWIKIDRRYKYGI